MSLNETQFDTLLAAAKQAANNAYCAYSGYQVGAAVLTRSGTVHAGCNMENASFTSTVCAEGNAVSTMICHGDRDILAVLVYANSDNPPAPCGNCRQIIQEFSEDCDIYIVDKQHQTQHYRLSYLLPSHFVLQE